MQILTGPARRGVVAVLLVLLTIVAGACSGSGPPQDLAELAAAVPAPLVERGLVLRTGPAGTDLVTDALGLPADLVRASATTGAPAVRVLAVDQPDRALAALQDAGFAEVDAAEGWQLLARPEGAEGFVGIPAVALGPGMVAVGSTAELRTLAEGGTGMPLPAEVIAEAAIALVQPGHGPGSGGPAAGAAGELPPFTAVVLTAAEEDTSDGVLALQLAGEGSQADAVGLSVRLRTAGPVDGAGRAVLRPGSPLTRGDVVRLPVTWAADAPEVLAGGLASGLLDFLG